MKHNKYAVILIMLMACGVMAFVDGVIQPGYVMKSMIKIPMFLILPLTYLYVVDKDKLKKLFTLKGQGLKIPLSLGLGIYLIILLAYFLFKDVFDFSGVTTSLGTGVGVDKTNFIWVALYISFVNSLLEEFFFRGFAFFALKEICSRRFAYVFSALVFALYHIAMMIGWFHIGVVMLALLGLFVGGVIFNFCNEKSGNIYTSWLIHMFANFAINTIGFMLFGII